jgi:hypothetical protein
VSIDSVQCPPSKSLGLSELSQGRAVFEKNMTSTRALFLQVACEKYAISRYLNALYFVVETLVEHLVSAYLPQTSRAISDGRRASMSMDFDYVYNGLHHIGRSRYKIIFLNVPDVPGQNFSRVSRGPPTNFFPPFPNCKHPDWPTIKCGNCQQNR